MSLMLNDHLLARDSCCASFAFCSSFILSIVSRWQQLSAVPSKYK